eukprot:127954-Amphidinium_carterae.2
MSPSARSWVGDPSRGTLVASKGPAWMPGKFPSEKAGDGRVGASDSVGGESGPPLHSSTAEVPNSLRDRRGRCSAVGRDEVRLVLPKAKAVVVIVEVGKKPLRELFFPLECRRSGPPLGASTPSWSGTLRAKASS